MANLSNSPTYAGALDPDGDFPLFEPLALLYCIKSGFRLGDPEFMGWICKDADIRFGDGSGG